MAVYRPDLGTEVPRRRFSAADVVQEAISGRRVDLRELLFRWTLILTLLISLGVLIVLICNVAAKGWHVFADRGGSFLANGNSAIASRAGIRQALVGSGMLMFFVIALAFPIGVGAAVYLEEYARDSRLTRFLSANIRNLAGVPSIVYGLLGLAIFVEAMRGFSGGLTVISGGLTLAVLVLPLVIITSMEAIRAVPDSIREAGFGVGATKWQVIRSHVLPSAAPGILTGTILSLARAFGETAPILLVGAQLGFFATGSGGVVDKLHGPYTSLPTIVFTWSAQPEADFRELAAAAILVLLAVLLVVNSAAIILRNRYERAR